MVHYVVGQVECKSAFFCFWRVWHLCNTIHGSGKASVFGLTRFVIGYWKSLMDVQHEDKKGKKIVSNHWKPNKTYKSVLKGSKERNGLHHCQDGLNIMWMPHLIQCLVWQVWGLLL